MPNSKKLIIKNNNILKNILFSIITIIIFLTLTEIVIRIFNIAPEYGSTKGMFQKDDLLDYRMAPNFKGTFVRQEFKIDIATNSYGLRDEEYYGKKKNDFNILALGDSFTWGAYGTSLNQTFVKILEKKLNENSNRLHYRVINAGVPGYGTDQEFIYLKTEGAKFKPDLVMLNFFVGNDFNDNMQTNESTVKDGLLIANKANPGFPEKFRAFFLLHLHSYRLIERGIISLFSDFINKHIKGLLEYDDYEAQLFLKPPNKDVNNQFETTRNILDGMNLYLKSRHIKFVIVVIPLNYQVDGALKNLFINKHFGKNQNFDMGQPQTVIREWAMQNNVTMIDLLPELSAQNSNDDFYWKLNSHFNAKGNEVAAKIIYREALNERN